MANYIENSSGIIFTHIDWSGNAHQLVGKAKVSGQSDPNKVLNPVNRQGEPITRSSYGIDAINIDWNGAKLNDETYLNTTGDLIKQLQLIYESLSSKANINDIPNSIYQLNGWNDFVLESSVADIFEEFKSYQKSPYDVYVQSEQENGNYDLLSKEDWLETLKGLPGSSGKSAYQIWLDADNIGTEEDFLNSLKGERGEKGDIGPGINILGYFPTLSDLYEETSDTTNGIGDAYNINGEIYVYNNLYNSSTDTIDNKWHWAGQFKGERGDTGKSAYDVYVEVQTTLGNEPLSKEDWIISLKGDNGEKGDKGDTGKSAYEIYVDVQEALGNEPLSESDWINSIGNESTQYIAGSGISIENSVISVNRTSVWGIIN